jgi:uncharacterized protein DUF3738
MMCKHRLIKAVTAERRIRMCMAFVIVGVFLGNGGHVKGQSAALPGSGSLLDFDVASVKPSRPDDPRQFTRIAPSRLTIVDETGLNGHYDFTLVYASEDASEAPSIFEALREQLGLEVKSELAPTTVLVITDMSRPAEN